MDQNRPQALRALQTRSGLRRLVGRGRDLKRGSVDRGPRSGVILRLSVAVEVIHGCWTAVPI